MERKWGICFRVFLLYKFTLCLLTYLQMLFIVLDVDSEDVQKILTLVDDTARRDAVPLVYFVQSDTSPTPGAVPQRKYRLDDTRPVTTTILSQFLRDVIDGNVKVRYITVGN